MEEESFEDQEAAALINGFFVAVKVDREERPDIDALYMAACQAMAGAGGWPLTLLLTPDKKPFFAGTYLPRNSRYGMTGLMDLLREASRLWARDRTRLLRAGDEAAGFLRRVQPPRAEEPDKKLLFSAVAQFKRSFDAEHGGWGPAPKFPSAHQLLYLLRFYELERDAEALRMAEKTLIQMARGGLFDQIGGGFSRYSTDRQWLIPHFEKMLYDNALLAAAYAEAYRVAARPFYRDVAVRTLDYVLRELTGPEGGFYCGQDADSGGEEGKYYALTPGEVETVLGAQAGKQFCDRFGVTARGNFEEKNIPHLLDREDFETADPRMADSIRKLYSYRLSRAPLHKDDKALTSWNALMITALSRAYRILGDVRFLEAAQRARRFVEGRLTGSGGRLFVRWRDGEAAHAALLDDYAFYAWAQLELYAAGFDTECLCGAARAATWMIRLFSNETSGGFYLNASDAERLIARPVEVYDGASPSGNSAAALVLVRLAALTGRPEWRELADRQLAFLAASSKEHPQGHSFSLYAMAEALYPAGELVIAQSGGRVPDELRLLIENGRLAALLKTEENADILAAQAPFTAAYPVSDETVYYLCRGGQCEAPVRRLEDLKKLLRKNIPAE